MISAQAHSAIMRNLGRIEGFAHCEEEDIKSLLLEPVNRICETLEAEMASEGESPTRFAGASFDRRTLPARRDAPFRQGAGDNPSVSFADSSPCTGEPIRKGGHHEEKPRTP